MCVLSKLLLSVLIFYLLSSGRDYLAGVRAMGSIYQPYNIFLSAQKFYWPASCQRVDSECRKSARGGPADAVTHVYST